MVHQLLLVLTFLSIGLTKIPSIELYIG